MHDNPFMRAKSDQTKGKILLVDDDPGLLRLLSIRLRAEEFDVVAVESAHDALGSLNRFSPDLVITDLRMDKMDGIGLLKELQTRSTRMNCCHWSSGRSRYRARLMSRKTGPRRSLRAMLQ
jgi:DNA-binding NtrC family response regulator